MPMTVSYLLGKPPLPKRTLNYCHPLEALVSCNPSLEGGGFARDRRGVMVSIHNPIWDAQRVPKKSASDALISWVW